MARVLRWRAEGHLWGAGMCTWTLEVSLITLHLARWAMVSQSAVWLPSSSSPYRSLLYLLGAVITGGPRRKRFSHWAISLAQRIHSSWKLVQRKFKLCKKKCYKFLKHDLCFEHLSHFSVFYFRHCFHLGASLCFKAETMTLFGECHMSWGDMAKALAAMSDDMSLMPPETNMDRLMHPTCPLTPNVHTHIFFKYSSFLLL